MPTAIESRNMAVLAVVGGRWSVVGGRWSDLDTRDGVTPPPVEDVRDGIGSQPPLEPSQDFDPEG